MNKKMIWTLVSFLGMAVSGIGTLLSNKADEGKMEVLIEQKINERFSAGK